MKEKNRIFSLFARIGIGLLQLIMIQLVTLVVSLFFTWDERYLSTHPPVFVVFLTLTFSGGVFLAGWLAIKQGWLKTEARYPLRAAGAVAGAALPLLVALAIYPTLEPGNPFFLIAMLGSITGFHIPGLRSNALG